MDSKSQDSIAVPSETRNYTVSLTLREAEALKLSKREVERKLGHTIKMSLFLSSLIKASIKEELEKLEQLEARALSNE